MRFICPVRRSSSAWDSPRFRPHIAKLVPLKRAGRAEEAAKVVCFLASDAASYVSGETFAVSGGLVFPGHLDMEEAPSGRA